MSVRLLDAARKLEVDMSEADDRWVASVGDGNVPRAVVGNWLGNVDSKDERLEASLSDPSAEPTGSLVGLRAAIGYGQRDDVSTW